MRNGSIDTVQVPALMCTSTGYGEQTINKNRRNGITVQSGGEIGSQKGMLKVVVILRLEQV